MSRLPKQTHRRELIKRFKELGWAGPHTGVGPHPVYMQHPDGRVKSLPNPHRSDISENLLKSILREAAITKEEWLGEEPKRLDEEATEDDEQPEVHGPVEDSLSTDSGTSRAALTES